MITESGSDGDIIEQWEPLCRGNPDTGEIVVGIRPFNDDYTVPDYRLKVNRTVGRSESTN